MNFLTKYSSIIILYISRQSPVECALASGEELQDDFIHDLATLLLLVL